MDKKRSVNSRVKTPPRIKIVAKKRPPVPVGPVLKRLMAETPLKIRPPSRVELIQISDSDDDLPPAGVEDLQPPINTNGPAAEDVPYKYL